MKSISLFKKAQLNEAILKIIPVVIILLFLGIVLTVSLKSTSNIKKDIMENKIASDTNNTLTWAGNNSAIGLVHYQLGFSDGSEKVYNNGTPVNKGDGIGGNYTTDATGGSIKVINASPSGKVGAQSEWVTNTINISYDYYFGSAERNITAKGQEGIKVVSDFQPTFGVIVVTSIVVTLIITLGIFVYIKMH